MCVVRRASPNYGLIQSTPGYIAIELPVRVARMRAHRRVDVTNFLLDGLLVAGEIGRDVRSDVPVCRSMG